MNEIYKKVVTHLLAQQEAQGEMNLNLMKQICQIAEATTESMISIVPAITAIAQIKDTDKRNEAWDLASSEIRSSGQAQEIKRLIAQLESSQDMLSAGIRSLVKDLEDSENYD